MTDGRFRIDVHDDQDRLAIDADRIRCVAADVLRHEGVAAAEVSVALVDGVEMRRLNREHLGHDYDTDVLSFLLDADGPDGEPDGLRRGAGKTLDGEIVISADVAAAAAADFRWGADDELLLYLVHGLLHLAGYDDLTDPEQATMRDRERDHLSRWGLTPAYADDGAAVPAGSPSNQEDG